MAKCNQLTALPFKGLNNSVLRLEKRRAHTVNNNQQHANVTLHSTNGDAVTSALNISNLRNLWQLTNNDNSTITKQVSITIL